MLIVSINKTENNFLCGFVILITDALKIAMLSLFSNIGYDSLLV